MHISFLLKSYIYVISISIPPFRVCCKAHFISLSLTSFFSPHVSNFTPATSRRQPTHTNPLRYRTCTTILILTSLIPLTLASPSPSLLSRDLTCIDDNKNPAPCTCACSKTDYLTNVNPPYSQNQPVNCAVPDSVILGILAGLLPPYGPVGCLSCQPFTGSDYEGAIPCEVHGGCQFNLDGFGSPEGCYCWTCAMDVRDGRARWTCAMNCSVCDLLYGSG